MFSKEAAKLLEESTRERSYGATADRSSTEPKTKSKSENIALSNSAPGILEPSKDTPRPPKPPKRNALEDSGSPPLNPWRTLVTCSDPAPSTRIPVNYNHQSNGRVDEQPIIDEQEAVENLGIWSILIKGYYNAAIWLRNSRFIYVIQLLFFIKAISALVMAVLYTGECLEDEALPTFSGITGAMGIAFTCLWMAISCCNRRGRETWEVVQVAFLAISLCYWIFVILEMYIFAAMSPSFNPLASNYCDKTFYYYAFYKEIATGVAAALFTLLYIPGCLVYLRCRCFAMPDNWVHRR